MFEIIAYVCIGIVVLEIIVMLIVLIATVTEEPSDTEKYGCLLTGRQCINPELGLQGCRGCPEIKEETEEKA